MHRAVVDGWGRLVLRAQGFVAHCVSFVGGVAGRDPRRCFADSPTLARPRGCRGRLPFVVAQRREPCDERFPCDDERRRGRTATLACMPESTLLAAALGVVAGALAVGLVVFLRRIVLASKELGTDAEQATYQTLHLASRAAKHLRAGGGEVEVLRAGRNLRALLGSESLAIVDRTGRVTVDGDDAVRAVAAELAAAAIANGKPQVRRGISIGARGDRCRRRADARQRGPVRRDRRVLVARAVRASCGRRARSPTGSRRRSSSASSMPRARRSPKPRCVRSARRSARTSSTTRSMRSRRSSTPTRRRRASSSLEFADFTRYSFRRHGDFTTVAEELRSIDSYLKLERARFGDRLKVTLQIAPEVLSTVVPFLSIQPLVENAVRHGLESKEGGGRITITAARLGRVRRDHRRGRRRRHRPRDARHGARGRSVDGRARGAAQRRRPPAAGLRRRARARRRDERRCGHARAHAGAEVAGREHGRRPMGANP